MDEVVFDIRTAIEWLANGSGKRPEPLFGDLWMTGEIGVMFAGPGCGKSVLAVQIAEAIARGRAVAPFECWAKRQKVLYLDLGSAPGHFDMRYEPDEGRRNRKPHTFSANLVRVCPTERELALDDLEPLIERSGARVLIIDSIEHLMNSARSSKEAEQTMRELRRLRRVHGLSILVIADATRVTPVRRGIEASEMPFAGTLALFADNVFAIGRVAADPAGRYIKHIKPGATALVYGSAHVPWFRITKRAGFTHFKFASFAREKVLRGGDEDRGEWATVRRIREMSDAGLSVRKIGAMLKMSKSTVQRYVEMSRDEAFAPPPEPDRWAEFLAAPRTDEYDWLEEYDAAIAEAGSNADDVRETYLLHLARANARKLFEKHGIEPTLAETLAKMRPNTTDWPERWGGGEDMSAPAAVATGGFDDSEQGSIHDQPPNHLERALDSNDNEVFVEKRDPYTGRMLVWYQAKTNRGIQTGTFTRWKREGYGIHGETVESLPRRGP